MPARVDAFQNVVADRRRDEDAVPDHEQVLGRTLCDVPVLSQDDRLVEALSIASLLEKAGFT